MMFLVFLLKGSEKVLNGLYEGLGGVVRQQHYTCFCLKEGAGGGGGFCDSTAW